MSDVVTGEVEPAGEGEWLTLREAAARLGIGEKAVYMQTRRKGRLSKKGQDGRIRVWVTESNAVTPEQPRNLAVPSAEMFRALVEQTAAPLAARIEEVVRENEQLRAEVERLQAALQPVEERLKAEARRSWWRRLFGPD